MKLYLLRHAKASHDPSFADHERPLAPEGRQDADAIGRWLGGLGIEPDRVLASSAVRTRETFDRVAAAAGWSVEPTVMRDLYLCRPADVLALLRGLGEAESALVVGHEPTTSSLASALTGGSEIKVPTGTLVRIGLTSASWSDLETGRERLEWIVPPKALSEPGER